MLRVALTALALGCGIATAQTVSLSGSLGDKALLLIDGKPRTLATGATLQGVKLVSVAGGEAVVEVGGKRVTLLLGGAQADLGGAASAGGGSKIVLSAGSGGHFVSDGSINGRPVRFVVDTGATNVSLGADQVQRLGIDLAKSQPGISNTANGQIAVRRVKLASVRVGDVTVYDIDATIVPLPMEMVLLGNSFLSRFQMNRSNDVLVLDKRY